MWHTLATLELALGCLYPIIIAVQHNFPPDTEMRTAAYFELQFHFRSLGFCIHPIRIRNEEHFTGQSVVIYLHNKLAYFALAEQYLMIYLKQNLAAEIEACWRIDTRYQIIPSAAKGGMIAVLPSVWWQTVISAMESTAPLNSIA